MAASVVEITELASDATGSIGYAKGKFGGREFTASWATWEPLGAIFYDTWLDATKTQKKAIARALTRMNSVPGVWVADSEPD